MTPYNVHDDLPDELNIKAVPAAKASADDRRAWLAFAFTAGGVGEVIRYGGVSCTPMTVEVIDQLRTRRIVRFDHERDAERHGTLRAELIRQGMVRAEHVTNGKVAGDAYFLMCSLGRVLGGVDPHDEVSEWISGYRLEARRIELSFAKGDLYRALDTIRRYPYSKRQINLWLDAVDGHGNAGEPPRPPLVTTVGAASGHRSHISRATCDGGATRPERSRTRSSREWSSSWAGSVGRRTRGTTRRATASTRSRPFSFACPATRGRACESRRLSIYAREAHEMCLARYGLQRRSHAEPREADVVSRAWMTDAAWAQLFELRIIPSWTIQPTLARGQWRQAHEPLRRISQLTRSDVVSPRPQATRGARCRCEPAPWPYRDEHGWWCARCGRQGGTV
jgi:hypothetical protein